MQTVIGAFEDRDTAQRAVERLIDAGFDRDDVHVEQGASTSSTGSTGVTTSSTDTRADQDEGFFASIGHFFASLFGDDQPTGRAGVYSEAVRRGTSVVVVDANDEEESDRAATLLHELGAIDVDERAEQWRKEGWTGYDAGLPMPDDAQSRLDLQSRDRTSETSTGREGAMDVVQEELQVGKRAVDRGGVRVIQRVSEKPVRELVRLREERAVVDRRPVDREATSEDLTNFREGTMEVRETVEEPVVSKKARVVEEVRVGKDVQEREQTIEDSVRRKDVDVERIEGEGRGTMERERAVASDRTLDGDTSMDARDPDSIDERVTGRKTLKTKTPKTPRNQ